MKVPMVNSLPSVLNLILMLDMSLSLKASDNMAANTMLKSVGASTQPCLTPFCNREYVRWNRHHPILEHAC